MEKEEAQEEKKAWRAKNFEQFILPLEIVNAFLNQAQEGGEKNDGEKLNEPWN